MDRLVALFLTIVLAATIVIFKTVILKDVSFGASVPSAEQGSVENASLNSIEIDNLLATYPDA